MNRQGDNFDPEADETAPQETIIDVSGDQPEVIEREPAPGTFFGRQSGEVRVWVAQSGARGCLIPIGVALLLVCCSCVGAWVLFDSLF